nr:MAG TPA: hypothetical protein [Caudoviricetes sp.]
MMYSSANSFCFKLIFTNFPSPLSLHNKKALFQALYKGLYKIICITFHKITNKKKKY